ncbi:MAG TPA: T9SS type A sorting domain-containing protein [Bacteroidales bacterium]|nr:T9SS type A sorting domain-containing protein [Bacteroidales bacterium]
MRFVFTNLKTLTSLTLLCLVLLLDFSELRGQEGEDKFKQDSTIEASQKSAFVSDADTNFTYERYGEFLRKISDTSRYIVVPINEFRDTSSSSKVVIGLRHDLDNNLDHAFDFSDTEWNLGFRSTYYILHTAPYYLKNESDKAIHNENIIPILQRMQNERHFEIGWHNDLVTLQLFYNIEPVEFFRNELKWLRSFGLNITGTASHGSPYCHSYHYLNFYFFEECTFPPVAGYENNVTILKDGKFINLNKGKLKDFGLKYEAYFLNNNKYYSDASFTNGVRWNIGMLDPGQLNAGDRVIILLHPIHWHKASVLAEIEYFNIPGQRYSRINAATRSISVVMPYGTDLSSLKSAFNLSPGAYARVNGTKQVSGSTRNDFRSPLNYSVIAENRDVKKEWNVAVSVERNTATAFKSYYVPGATRNVKIDAVNRIITLELTKGVDLTSLPVQFELSEGARAWIQNAEQFGNSGTVDLTAGVVYRILAEDGVTQSFWTVRVTFTTDSEDMPVYEEKFLVYPNPSEGLLHVQFINVEKSPSQIEVFNFAGEKILTKKVDQTGNFNVDIDLTNEAPGMYIVRNLNTGQRIVVVIQ